MDSIDRQIMDKEQALLDIRSWLESHNQWSDEVKKKLMLAQKIVEIYLIKNYLDDEYHTMENYDLEVLFGYSFFLSRGADFDYNRSYLIDKSSQFINNRKDVARKFEDIIDHFNQLLKLYDIKLRPYRVQYNDLYVFLFNDKMQRWEARIKYNNIDKIICCQKDILQLCVKSKYISTNNVLYTQNMDSSIVDIVGELNLLFN